MPDICAAYGCSNRRGPETKQRGITFHVFPKGRERRRQWEIALRRKNFTACDRSQICSDHFRPEDFDRTGQTVRLRAGAVPSIFNFPGHLQRPVKTRSTATSRRAAEKLDSSVDVPKRENEPVPIRNRCEEAKRLARDHAYVLPASPKAIKAKLDAAYAKVRQLEREKLNALIRERRAKKTLEAVLEELEAKNQVIDELQDKLDRYSDIPVELLARRGMEYTQEQIDFALTLHLHGPKAYNYLRKTLKIHLPHPSSLRRHRAQLPASTEASTDPTSFIQTTSEEAMEYLLPIEFQTGAETNQATIVWE